MKKNKNILVTLFVLLTLTSFAGGTKSKTKSTEKTATKTTTTTKVEAKTETKAEVATTNEKKINWLTWDEMVKLNEKNPKKIFIDFYTSWCGWCKVMDKKTFSNKELAQYMNENFYALKLDAEQKDTINFKGKKFGFVPAQRSNQLAVELLQGRMSYPTTVILDENFQNPIPIPGYQDVPTMEKILKYIATDTYKTVQFPEYE
jgi:thioredoxin-related protein